MTRIKIKTIKNQFTGHKRIVEVEKMIVDASRNAHSSKKKVVADTQLHKFTKSHFFFIHWRGEVNWSGWHKWKIEHILQCNSCIIYLEAMPKFVVHATAFCRINIHVLYTVKRFFDCSRLLFRILHSSISLCVFSCSFCCLSILMQRYFAASQSRNLAFQSEKSCSQKKWRKQIKLIKYGFILSCFLWPTLCHKYSFSFHFRERFIYLFIRLWSRLLIIK